MFTLACKDLGAKHCNYVAKSDTAEGAVDKMMEHANKAHRDQAGKINKEEMMNKVVGEDGESMGEDNM